MRKCRMEDEAADTRKTLRRGYPWLGSRAKERRTEKEMEIPLLRGQKGDLKAGEAPAR